MSKLWRNFIEKVMDGNPYTKHEFLSAQLDAEYKDYHTERKEWISGLRSPLTQCIAEWDYLGKPKHLKALKK